MNKLTKLTNLMFDNKNIVLLTILLLLAGMGIFDEQLFIIPFLVIVGIITFIESPIEHEPTKIEIMVDEPII